MKTFSCSSSSPQHVLLLLLSSFFTLLVFFFFLPALCIVSNLPTFWTLLLPSLCLFGVERIYGSLDSSSPYHLLLFLPLGGRLLTWSYFSCTAGG